MLELPNGRIKMSDAEIACYRHFSGQMSVPKTRAEFTTSLVAAATAMRARMACGQARRNDSEIGAEMIEEYLSSPHYADAVARHRAWIAAGCPMGEEAMRQAGLSSPALDRLQPEREAQSRPWVSIQSALSQAELFADRPSRRE